MIPMRDSFTSAKSDPCHRIMKGGNTDHPKNYKIDQPFYSYKVIIFDMCFFLWVATRVLGVLYFNTECAHRPLC